MAAKVIILLTVFGILAVLETGVKALECYRCNNCGDPFKSSDAIVLHCDNYCVKGKRESDGKVARTCDFYAEYGKMNDCKMADTPLGHSEVCLCTTDRCNGVGNMRMHFLPLLTFAAILVVARKMLF
ncbi:uncharacterized protein LOC123545498 [Mercenaria mercenaria]|uniref:uncharacterized protein LOC123545498 n=1 Tax=Mercenaria mercenaria TaxID=6596 RepID=UPI00234E8529|nr:uncharacterized protein LOC123545498 [Mercenaria mercenaria]